MHHRIPEPQVHHYPHHRDHTTNSGTSAQEKAELLDLGADSTTMPIDDEYTLEMGLAGAHQ